MSDPKVNQSKREPVKVVIALLVLSIAGGAVWYFFIRKPATPHNLIKLSDRIEGDDTTVATKISGRIREINVREGDQVKAVQVVALIDDEQIRAREQQEQLSVKHACWQRNSRSRFSTRSSKRATLAWTRRASTRRAGSARRKHRWPTPKRIPGSSSLA